MNHKNINNLSISRKMRLKGTISLEAALVFPVMIAIILLFVLAIQTVRDSIILGHALDQTANEIALLLPLEDVLESVVDAVDQEEWIRKTVSDPTLAKIAVDGMSDLASTLLASPFILNRVSYWSRLTATGQHCSPPDGEMKLAFDFDKNRKTCWLILSYRKMMPQGAPWQVIRSRVPIWNVYLFEERDDTSYEEDEDKDSVWMLSNFERGAAIRAAFGGHLPPFYPVIAMWNGVEAVSIKSMDITAPTYRSQDAAEKKIMHHVESLAAFQGAGEEGPSPGEIKKRRLILVIPDNSVSWKTSEVITCWQNMAASLGVILDVREYGTSYLYQDSD